MDALVGQKMDQGGGKMPSGDQVVYRERDSPMDGEISPGIMDT